MSTVRVAVPSKGRLRDAVLLLLEHAGYQLPGLSGAGSVAAVDGIEFVEMRPRDAGSWLAAGRLDAAFVSTDIVLEESLDDLDRTPLGMARSDLVVASRASDGRTDVRDLAGAVVATHLPGLTRRWFERHDIGASVIPMGGSLEGVCAAGLADAVVDLRETGTSLALNRLRALAVIEHCQAELVAQTDLPDLSLRLGAALDARQHRYLMLHLDPDRVGELRQVFPGLAAPTVLPLAGREDLVAVHLVVESASLFRRLSELRGLGASGVVALAPDALLR
jgi:ATP phosphoribosyltransferase